MATFTLFTTDTFTTLDSLTRNVTCERFLTTTSTTSDTLNHQVTHVYTITDTLPPVEDSLQRKVKNKRLPHDIFTTSTSTKKAKTWKCSASATLPIISSSFKRAAITYHRYITSLPLDSIDRYSLPSLPSASVSRTVKNYRSFTDTFLTALAYLFFSSFIIPNNALNVKATISIANPSPLTKEMLNNLPDNYDKTQSTGNFTLLYGTGYELETLKQELEQGEANNYLYSPDTQEGNFNIEGIGIYLIEFDIPFVIPPLNVSISGADTTDVFIETTSRFSMIVNVQTSGADTLQYRASGFVGAASDEYLGDALYNNFGALYGFPRAGDSQINNTYVNLYTKTNTFVSVQKIIPVEIFQYPFNIPPLNTQALYPTTPLPNPNYTVISQTPPINQQYIKGIIRPTSVISAPEATDEIFDSSGNLLALLDCSTTSQAASAYYLGNNNNIFKTHPEVYIIGAFSTFNFDAWQQPSYLQEVYRADNVYRRILSAINKSLYLGPTINGVSNMIEALVAQPFIPHEIWDDNDFRIFKNSIGLTYPKFNNEGFTSSINDIILTAENGTELGADALSDPVTLLCAEELIYTPFGESNTQYETYPSIPPTVEVKRVMQPWSATTITYNSQPNTISMETPVKQTINILNNATQFNIADELSHGLRLGLDLPTGGIINWNYQDNGITINSIPPTGLPLYEEYNYVFLNNPGDSIANISIFWYAQQGGIGATSYYTFPMLQYGRDYFIFPTTTFLLPNGTYELPSELLTGYACNAAIPYQSDGSYWTGVNLTNTAALPQFIIQLDLRNIATNNLNHITPKLPTKMPTNPYDFILYTYSQVTLTQAGIAGSYPPIRDATNSHNIAAYYDADTSNAYQPTDSPFYSASGLPITALAQSSFAKITTATGYEYITTMIGGQITFNKTILVNDLLTQANQTNGLTGLSAPGIFIIQALYASLGPVPTPTLGRIGTNQYKLTGTVQLMQITPSKRYFQFAFGNYVLVDTNGYPIAIFDPSSLINLNVLINQEITVTGVVFYTLWDTRIPVTNYRTGSPVFQAKNNFNTQVIPFTPDISTTTSFLNDNFLVQINGLPLGNQQTVTVSWTFNIIPTSTTVIATEGALGFSDSVIQRGIMSLFTGLNLIFNYVNNFILYSVDVDNATYDQEYISPSFSGFFIDYNDYTNSFGGKLMSSGDANGVNTLTISTTKTLNTILNFFSPKYGFISLSILPNMEFFMTNNGGPITVTRPNNNGIALQIDGNTYAGLTFYGSNQNKIVDKPTRLIADYTYDAASGQARKKVVEIEDGGYANWVDGKYPNVVQTGSTFYIAGNLFKYPHEGYAQAQNQYNAPGAPLNAGNYYNRLPISPTDDSEPVFLTDPSQNLNPTLSDRIGEAGPPERYRRAHLTNSTGVYETPGNLALINNYYNTTPEKIAYIQFDLSNFPIDTIVNNAILEIYFCSGFTIKEGRNIDFELNKNKAWQKSRLSGNGKTYLKTLTDAQGNNYTLNSSLENVHWRKNFFEIIIPYVFNSEPNGADYGIRNLFSNTVSNALPKPQNPQPNLEYLGYLNMDEIDTTSLTGTEFTEISVGLTNIILSLDSTIYLIDGILSFDNNGTTLMNQFYLTNLYIYALHSAVVIGTIIDQKDVLPNMKVLVFPFGNLTASPAPDAVFFYGYTKSVLGASLIGFDSGNINIYQKVLNFVLPNYAEYSVKLLEADTYFGYKEFGKESTIADTTRDIAY